MVGYALSLRQSHSLGKLKGFFQNKITERNKKTSNFTFIKIKDIKNNVKLTFITFILILFYYMELILELKINSKIQVMEMKFFRGGGRLIKSRGN